MTMWAEPDDIDEDDEELPSDATVDVDPIAQAIGATGYVDRYTLDACVERYGQGISRFPDTFDRFYFDADGGPVLIDVLVEDTPGDRAAKHVDFKTEWCAEHDRRYLVLTDDELSPDRIRRLLSGAPEPKVSQPASKRAKPAAKRGQIQRPKATA